MALHEELKAIRTGIRSVLTPLLEEKPDERGICFGDRVRMADIKDETLWVFPDDSPISHAGMALAEEWTYNYVIAALVRWDDAEEGMDMAEALASRASALLVADRTLGGAVRDTVRVRFLPGYATSVASGPQLHWAAFAMESKFRHREE